VARNFSSGYSYNKEDTLKINSDTLYLDANILQPKYKGLHIGNSSNYSRLRIHGIELQSTVNLEIVISDDQNFHLTEYRTSRGESVNNAQKYAQQIIYNYQQKYQTLTLDNSFKTGSEDPFRGQDLDLILSVPVGKIISFTPAMLSLLYNIENVENVLDKDMPDHKWIMTGKGLSCLDCPDNIKRQENESGSDSGENNLPHQQAGFAL
jgi:hypothetical protein